MIRSWTRGGRKSLTVFVNSPRESRSALEIETAGLFCDVYPRVPEKYMSNKNENARGESII